VGQQQIQNNMEFVVPTITMRVLYPDSGTEPSFGVAFLALSFFILACRPHAYWARQAIVF
jgi:hypothetical protein